MFNTATFNGQEFNASGFAGFVTTIIYGQLVAMMVGDEAIPVGIRRDVIPMGL